MGYCKYRDVNTHNKILASLVKPSKTIIKKSNHIKQKTCWRDILLNINEYFLIPG